MLMPVFMIRDFFKKPFTFVIFQLLMRLGQIIKIEYFQCETEFSIRLV